MVQKTFEFLAYYNKFPEVDHTIISQFQYKHEVTTYESFFDQSICILFKLSVYLL